MERVRDNTDLADSRRDQCPDGTGTADALINRLNLPEEVTTQQAAEILGCCKHTVLQYLEEGFLEWRNAAPLSSARPVYRFTLRSVLELRLGYKVGSANPQGRGNVKPRKRTATASGHQLKHVRRKESKTRDA